MKDEKRMAGDYEIIHAIHIGDREVVFGIDEKNKQGLKYMCGYCTKNELFESFDENFISNDYPEIMSIFCDRVKSQIEATKENLKQITVPLDTITSEMCFVNDYSNSLVNKIVAIKQSVLRNEYQTQAHQLVLVTGGFGAEANSRGSACFCTNLYSGKNNRWERRDIQGEVKPEYLPQWAKDKLSKILNAKEQSTKQVDMGAR